MQKHSFWATDVKSLWEHQAKKKNCQKLDFFEDISVVLSWINLRMAAVEPNLKDTKLTCTWTENLTICLMIWYNNFKGFIFIWDHFIKNIKEQHSLYSTIFQHFEKIRIFSTMNGNFVAWPFYSFFSSHSGPEQSIQLYSTEKAIISVASITFDRLGHYRYSKYQYHHHNTIFTNVTNITHAGTLHTADPVTGWYSGWSSCCGCVLMWSVWRTWTTVGAGVWNTGQEVRLTLG